MVVELEVITQATLRVLLETLGDQVVELLVKIQPLVFLELESLVKDLLVEVRLVLHQPSL
jgi:hypothetical protein